MCFVLPIVDEAKVFFLYIILFFFFVGSVSLSYNTLGISADGREGRKQLAAVNSNHRVK